MPRRRSSASISTRVRPAHCAACHRLKRPVWKSPQAISSRAACSVQPACANKESGIVKGMLPLSYQRGRSKRTTTNLPYQYFTTLGRAKRDDEHREGDRRSARCVCSKGRYPPISAGTGSSTDIPRRYWTYPAFIALTHSKTISPNRLCSSMLVLLIVEDQMARSTLLRGRRWLWAKLPCQMVPAGVARWRATGRGWRSGACQRCCWLSMRVAQCQSPFQVGIVVALARVHRVGNEAAGVSWITSSSPAVRRGTDGEGGGRARPRRVARRRA